MRSFLIGTGRSDLESLALQCGEKSFRGRQLAQWIYERLEADPGRMSNLPAAFRAQLKSIMHAPGSRVGEVVTATDGVEKMLIELWDGEAVEMVLIPAGDGRLTFCLSTQVGCPVGCCFCASGASGFTRNLVAGEILEEFLFGCARAGRRCDNIVFMGIGEGLLNFSELSRALDILSSADYFKLSPRRITVSTSGVVPGILKLAELRREYNLAISLHAPDDKTRALIIPDRLRYPIAEVLAAADRWSALCGRQYTLEYTLLAGINDSDSAAAALGALARRHRAKVNLIACNPTDGKFRRPAPDRIRDFEAAVAAAGARVTCRVERGGTQTAACGQLRVHRKSEASDDGK